MTFFYLYRVRPSRPYSFLVILGVSMAILFPAITAAGQAAAGTTHSRKRSTGRSALGTANHAKGDVGQPSSPASSDAMEGEPSEASKAAPQTGDVPKASSQQIRMGRDVFSAQCTFCHGPDGRGGQGGGTDLMTSPLVARDVTGQRMRFVIRNGRGERGMPAFSFPNSELTAVVAFIHDLKAKTSHEAKGKEKPGGRRTVDVTDLQTGNPEAGRQYFEGAGGCAKCHSPTGDLAGVASRLQGLELLERMLYPGGRRRASTSTPTQHSATARVELPSGQTVTGPVAYRDEFTIAIVDESGWYRSWPASQVKFTVTNPLDAHAEQLRKYTDDDMHNVLAYLQTLRSEKVSVVQGTTISKGSH